MAAKPPTWRARARAVIQAVIAEGRARDLTDDQIRAAVDAAYPFGERQYYPYAVWLEERKALLSPAARTERARLNAWENAAPIVDPGGPLSPLEQYLEDHPDG